MTVSSNTDRTTFLGNGVTQVFPLPFRFFDNGDIQAWLVTNATGVLSPLTLGVHYTLSGAGDPEVDGSATGQLTMLSAPSALQSLFVQRTIPLTQPTDIINQGRFFPEIHETAFDRLLMQIQQASGDGRGAIRVAIGDPEPARLSPAASRADQLLGFDSQGNPVAVAPVSGSASDLAANLGNSADPAKGASMVGYKGRTVRERLSDRMDIEDFPGGAPSELVSNAGAIESAIDAAKAAVKRLFLTAGRFLITPFILRSGAGHVAITGEGKSQTVLVGAPGANLLNFQANTSVEVRDLTIEKNSALSTDTGHGLVLIDQPDALVRDVAITEFGGIGSGVIAYSSDPALRVANTVIENVRVDGDYANSDNTNGVLIENGVFSRMQGLYVSGIREFGTEFKNDTRYSIASDIIANNSGYALGYGQTTPDDTGVSGCVASSIIGVACNVGMIIGKGDLNVTTGAFFDSTGSIGTQKRGVITALNADRNFFSAILTAGDMLEPVRLQSNRNYVQLATHDTSTNVVTFTAGSEKNVVEIAHPGVRTTILANILNASGFPRSGSQSNPVYCHATGEHIGTLSGRWLFSHAAADTTKLSSHKHVLESTGDTFYSVHHNGANNAGLNVTSPTKSASLQYNTPSAYWQMGDADWFVRAASTVTRPGSDNIMDLGSAANRFKVVYAGTGTINTSDGREKQQVRELSEQERAVAIRLKSLIRAFKFNDAVDDKGDGARIHVGVIAQDVVAAFAAEGLDAHDYALLCHDSWDASEELRGETGDIIEPARLAGDRYGVRYEELLAFVISAI